MKPIHPPLLRWIFAALLTTASLVLASGCANDSNAPTRPPAATQPAAAVPGQPAAGQPVFDSDQAAADALLAAVRANDHAQVHRLLGPEWKELLSGDPVEDADDFKDFAARSAEGMRIEKADDSTSLLRVGSDNWLFPIPIVRDSQGKWFLDAAAGKQEVLARRVGQNELEAIHICRLYVQAQREYARQDPDGAGVPHYAQRILSTPGKRDGLYWHTAADQPKSPLARWVEQEKLEGYAPAPGKHMPYRGYRFRILKRQGPDAPGGAIDYLNNGKMTGGFALVAYPVVYRSSGVMTFIVNQDGKVYQKDLGSDTAQTARHMTEFNPDKSWTLVNDGE
jgi:hypothetical protein